MFEKESDTQKGAVFRVSPALNLSNFMAMRRFDDIKSYFPHAFADFEKSDSNLPNHDPWFMFSMFINAFNKNRAKTVAASVIKLLDESMSAWHPRKDKTGGLPNISFISPLAE